MPAWIPIVIVLIAASFYLVVKLFKSKGDDKREILNDAKTEVADIKEAADVKLAAEFEAVNADKAELEAIQEINDESERLTALAKYGNRQRGPK